MIEPLCTHRTAAQIVMTSDSQDPMLAEAHRVLAAGQAAVTVLINGMIAFAGVVEAHELVRGPGGISTKLHAHGDHEVPKAEVPSAPSPAPAA
jgi:hypothetical protein